MIISSHMDSMLKIPRVVSALGIEQVRTVYDKIEINVRSLQALGIKSEMYGSLLIPVIMDKIPEEFRLMVSRKLKSDTWDINELMAALKEELEAREKSTFVGGNINVVERPWFKSKKVHYPSAVAALHVTERVQTNCYFCNRRGYKSFNCILVTDPERRREILKRKGRCFVCLRTGHVANHYQSELTCSKCNGRHHGSLCLALELPSLHSENLVIKTFGSDSDRPKRCDVVQFCVSKTGGGLNLYLNAYPVPSICSPLCHQRIEFAMTSYEHLSNLELADSFSGATEMPIDVLIGSDFYWNFMTGKTCTGKNGGLVAINTHLG